VINSLRGGAAGGGTRIRSKVIEKALEAIYAVSQAKTKLFATALEIALKQLV
jgi:hypothetical protein